MKQRIISIFMMILIVMMPTVYADTSTNFPLTATVPGATSDGTIKITGVTKPNIEVTVILNMARVAELTSDSDGNFETDTIILVREDNELTVKAKDSSNNIRTLHYKIKSDSTPPVVNYGAVPTGSQTRTLRITGTTSEPVSIRYRATNISAYQTTQVQDSFNLSVDLEDGLNKLELTASDEAGNTDVQRFDIIYDIIKPSFLTTNLDNLEPCYLDVPAVLGKKVDIRGQTNEKATILVYVNHESNPSKIRTTDDSGNFRIKNVHLDSSVQANVNASRTVLDLGTSYVNHVRLVAKDLAGNEETIIKTIACGGCAGGAGGFTMNTAASLGSIMPASLLPKLLIQGIEMITIPFNISYTGLQKAVIRDIRIDKVTLAPEFEKDYDNDQIKKPNAIKTLTRDRQGATGVIQIQINKFDPLGAVEPDATRYRRELNVSKHRYAKCALQTGYGDLNYGCMKFFLTMEIPYQEVTTISYLDPNTQKTREQIKRENKVQKICIPQIELPIDRIAEGFVPSKMARKQVKNIDHVLRKIEPVQEKLELYTEYAMYTCLGAVATTTLSKLAELTTCTIGEALAIGSWSKDVASAGLCDYVYADEFDSKLKGNAGRRRACNSCMEVKKLRKWLQYEVMNRVCDRVGCPAAKTFKAYIRDKTGDVEDITPKIDAYYTKAKNTKDIYAADVTKKREELILDHGVIEAGEKIFTGSDCGFTLNPKLISPTYEDVGSAKGIKTLYQQRNKASNAEYCVKYARAAHPDCCGIEYDREWSSACGIGKISGTSLPIVDYDELKESTCYAARQAGKPNDLGCGGLDLWNAVAGFCEANTGKAKSEVVYTGMNYKSLKQDAEDNRVYVFVSPKTNTAKEEINYKVSRGYALKKVRYNANPTKYSGARELTESLFEVHEKDLSQYFKEGNEKAQMAGFKKELCSGDVDGCTSSRVERTYKRVKEMIGAPDKEYIVRADSGILRAIQCICFPAVNAWLEEWTNILRLLRNCLATVELGKGDAGVCDDFITQAICDRIYDIIKCFSNKLSVPGVGKRIGGDLGIGSIIGILTNTASEMSNTLQGRYGETGMWSALFNEKQLVHGICIWALTSKWDMSIEQLMKNTIEEVAIESTPFLGECKKYFRGYSPKTNPSGLTTWAYECSAAMVAGANLKYKIKLQCSDDFSCSEKDGYRNNECDCVKTGKEYVIMDQGTMKRGDMFNKKIIYPVQAGPVKSQKRYDTAIFYYEWEDPKTNQKRSDEDTTRYITQGGALPFGYCSFDPFTLAFRCQIGKEEGGIKIKSIDKDYKYKHKTKKTKAFLENEDFRFDISVKQKMPDDNQEEAKKYMYYRILDHTNSLVTEIKPSDDSTDIIFESDGAYTKQVSIDLDDDLIKTRLDEIPGAAKLAFIETDGLREKTDASRYISSYEATKEKENTAAIVVLEPNQIKVYQYRSRTSTEFTKGELIATIPSSEGEIIAEEDIAGKTNKVTFNVEELPALGEKVEIYLPKKSGAKSPLETGNPAEWKIIFTLYDANEYGEVSEQITISPEGDTQQKTETFKIILAENGIDIEATVAPISTPGSNATPA